MIVLFWKRFGYFHFLALINNAGMSTHELFELMGTEGKLVKRPLLVVRCDEKITAVCAGFREEEWTVALNL